MYHLPFVHSVVSSFSEYLRELDTSAIVGNPCIFQPMKVKDECGSYDKVKERLLSQTLENWHENMATVLSSRLQKVIIKAVKAGFARKEVQMSEAGIANTLDSRFRDVLSYNEYDYTALDIAESNPLKISGIRKVRIAEHFLNSLESAMATNQMHYSGGSVKEWVESQCKYRGLHWALAVFAEGCNISPSFREEKGTYIKPAKIVKLFFGEYFNDDEISVIAGKIASELRLMSYKDVSMVQVSEDVASVYKTDTSSSLESCMAYEDIPSHRFKIYNDIKSCKIAYIVEHGLLVARALLWDDVTDEKTGEKYKIMDRIYYAHDDVLAVMQNWAIKNGYTRKARQALHVRDFIKPNGEEVFLRTLSVPCRVEACLYKEVPYIDTFAYCDMENPYKLVSSVHGRLLSLEVDEDIAEGHIIMQTTGGRVSWICSSGFRCMKCGEMIPVGQIEWVYNHPYCEECFADYNREPDGYDDEV